VRAQVYGKVLQKGVDNHKKRLERDKAKRFVKPRSAQLGPIKKTALRGERAHGTKSWGESSTFHAKDQAFRPPGGRQKDRVEQGVDLVYGSPREASEERGRRYVLEDVVDANRAGVL